jgi:halogenation protein CepH
MKSSSYEVIVIGGGPAGSSCATFLSQKGHKVILLEKETFPRFMVGESLLPAVWDLWKKLGVIEKLESIAYPVKRGVSIHLMDTGAEYTFRADEFPDYFPRPYTYHVDRASFDQILLNNAREKNVDAREGCVVDDVLFDGERAVGVAYTDEYGQKQEIHSQVVVDATGRSTLLAKKLGRRYPNPSLRKVAYYTHFKGAGRRVAEDGSTMTDIFTTEGGWIWCIPLPDDISSIGVVLDIDYVQGQSDGPQELFDKSIAGNKQIADWLATGEQAFKLKGVPSISYLSDNFVGDGFAMIGDAAMFVDPIFSAGVTLAMRGGDLAADTISEALKNGDTSESALKPFEEKIRHPVENMYKMIVNWYEILENKDRENIFSRSIKIPMLRERLVVLWSGGYEKTDLEGYL